MAKISLAKCLSSMNLPVSHAQQPHKHRQHQHHQQQQHHHNHQMLQHYDGEHYKHGDQPQPTRQPTGEKKISRVFVHTELYKSAYVTAS